MDFKGLRYRSWKMYKHSLFANQNCSYLANTSYYVASATQTTMVLVSLITQNGMFSRELVCTFQFTLWKISTVVSWWWSGVTFVNLVSDLSTYNMPKLLQASNYGNYNWWLTWEFCARLAEVENVQPLDVKS